MQPATTVTITSITAVSASTASPKCRLTSAPPIRAPNGAHSREYCTGAAPSANSTRQPSATGTQHAFLGLALFQAPEDVFGPSHQNSLTPLGSFDSMNSLISCRISRI